ncbi:uncharacterized protein LOC132264333 [Phlebotomus argentipes]|uniref:uncharacterized protein LOC132264333 n=1 Tax=Phlebotomus argentipes TaxID=94469 RepID=UPI0028930931|nr:uncharacterized protein LOC132264333 [Phlebotomus argentipes]
MSSQARDVKNLWSFVDQDRLRRMSVTSALEICKSYVVSEGSKEGSEDSTDKSVEVINFLLSTQDFADKVLLTQAVSLIQACLPGFRVFVSRTLKANLLNVLDKIITIIDTLLTTVTFFAEKFHWTKHHLKLRDVYLNVLTILTEVFMFSSKNNPQKNQLTQDLIDKSTRLHLFLLEKLSSTEISFFVDCSSEERDFLIEVLGILFLMGEVSQSINPFLWGSTWKNTHKIIAKNNEELKKVSDNFKQCLQAPIKFICRQIRETIREAVQTEQLTVLKITKFYQSIITKLLELFPGNFLPHCDMILENLFYLQSVRFLKKSQTAEDIHKMITDPYMSNIRILQRNEQFIECLVNTKYSHDSEIYAFFVISTEVLRVIGQENQVETKEALVDKILSMIPSCYSTFLDFPDIFKDLTRNLFVVLTKQEKYKNVWVKFLGRTLKNPSFFGNLTCLKIHRNIQNASRESVRFETFVVWKNSLERVSIITQPVLLEDLLRNSFDCLSTESQHRVVSLNNPQKNFLLWSILGLDRIPNAEKKNFLVKKLIDEVEKLISDFLGKNFTVKSVEDMILILRILGRTTFSPEEEFKKKFMEVWEFIGNKMKKTRNIISWIVNPLLEIFRNISAFLSTEDNQKILGIIVKISSKDNWPAEIHIEIISCLKIISENDIDTYWTILRCYKKSSDAFQLLAKLTEEAVGLQEPEPSKSPPNKRFKADFGSENEVKLRKILQSVNDFRENFPAGHSLPPNCASIVQEIVSSLRKITNS